MDKWKGYVRGKTIANHDGSVKGIFKSVRGHCAPSSLWVIYSCVNTYFQEPHRGNLKMFPRLQRYMKAQSSKYVCSKSKTLTAK